MSDAFTIFFRVLESADFPASLSLWEKTPGVGVRPSDTQIAFTRYVTRNPGLSYAALTPEGRIVGTVMGGHDGHRGYLYHLAVDDAYRKQGIASDLVNRSLEGLKSEGITKVTLFVLEGNLGGKQFWEAKNWNQREDLLIFQKDLNFC